MSEIQGKYYELMELFKDYDDAFKSLYKLKTNKEYEINEIYLKIKAILIESNLFSPKQILEKIFFDD